MPPPPDPQAALARLRATARDLVALTSGASADRLGREPEEGEWSPGTVISHLADAELVYSVRIRMALTGDRPYLPAFDERSWARRFAELDDDPKQALARWRVLRDQNVKLLASLDDDEWKLTGVHAERGELSVTQMADLLAKHDSDHLGQIRQGLAGGE
jgi:hypothetical protein